MSAADSVTGARSRRTVPQPPEPHKWIRVGGFRRLLCWAKPWEGLPMLSFLAVPAVIILLMVVTGFVIVPIQRAAHRRAERKAAELADHRT